MKTRPSIVQPARSLILIPIFAIAGCAHNSVSKVDWKEDLAARALAGDPQAAQALSGHYSTGDYNPRLSRYWAGVGTANGNAVCMYNLGMLCLQALGGPEDRILAEALIRAAAEKGVISEAEVDALLNEK
jgi:hypothetical protein